MDRLTARLPDGTAYVASETGTEGVGHYTTQRRLPELIARLAAYEDTGLEPKEIVHLSREAALRAHQERERPKPLTLDELRQMDGEPVWIEFIYPGNTCPPHWRIWHTKEYAECELDACGKDWRAYRRNPEGGETK